MAKPSKSNTILIDKQAREIKEYYILISSSNLCMNHGVILAQNYQKRMS